MIATKAAEKYIRWRIVKFMLDHRRARLSVDVEGGNLPS